MREHKRQVDRPRRRGRSQRSRVAWWVVGVLGVVAVVAVLVAVGNLGGGGDGVQITASDPRQVGPVEVTATRLDLGQVPLGQWVNPTFRLRNTGTEPVSITIPSDGVETLEGC